MTVSLPLISGSYPPMLSIDRGIHSTFELVLQGWRVTVVPFAAVTAVPRHRPIGLPFGANPYSKTPFSGHVWPTAGPTTPAL